MPWHKKKTESLLDANIFLIVDINWGVNVFQLILFLNLVDKLLQAPAPAHQEQY